MHFINTEPLPNEESNE
jgi:hypothetical protein